MAGWGPREYRWTAYPSSPVVFAPPARRGLRFSREEYRHILLAAGALIAAFVLSSLDLLRLQSVSGAVVLRTVVGSTVAVVTGFLLHELAHKAVAQRYGAWAEFRSSQFGLILAVITGLFGFVFAAPGAVFVAGALSRDQNGRVSLAGPLTNLVLGVLFVTAYVSMAALLVGEAGLFIERVLFLTAYINLFLGGFNMIPVPPLDGSKVLAWNPGVWIGTLVAIGSVFVGLLILTGAL